jgi:hypothetical protein
MEHKEEDRKKISKILANNMIYLCSTQTYIEEQKSTNYYNGKTGRDTLGNLVNNKLSNT